MHWQTEFPDEVNALDIVSVPPGDDKGTELGTEKVEHQEEGVEQGVEANHRPEVEVELWDLFREEFHEGMHRFSSMTYD